MARTRRRKRSTTQDHESTVNKKQCTNKEPEQKRNPAKEALRTALILRCILNRLPLLDRFRNRRINKAWRDTVDTFPDVRHNSWYEPGDAQEIICWRACDGFGNFGPFIADARWEEELKDSSPVPVITVHPLLARMDAYVKKNAPAGSALARGPVPLKFSFELRICPEWLIAIERDSSDRKWRDMYVTQPPCISVPEVELENDDGVTLGMLADECVKLQAMRRPKMKQLDEDDDMPPPSPFKIEMYGVREGSFWVRMARGEIEMGTLFVPAVHGF